MKEEILDFEARDKQIKFGFLEKFKIWLLYNDERKRQGFDSRVT